MVTTSERSPIPRGRISGDIKLTNQRYPPEGGYREIFGTGGQSLTLGTPAALAFLFLFLHSGHNTNKNRLG